MACVLRLILIRSGCRDKQQSQFRSSSFLLTPPPPTPPPPSSLSYLQITLHGHVYLHDNGASMPSQAITLSGLPFTGIDRTNAITTYLHVRSQTAVKLPPPPLSLSSHANVRVRPSTPTPTPSHPHTQIRERSHKHANEVKAFGTVGEDSTVWCLKDHVTSHRQRQHLFRRDTAPDIEKTSRMFQGA